MKKDTTIPPGYRRVLPYSIVNDLPTAVFFFSAAGQIIKRYKHEKADNIRTCSCVIGSASKRLAL